MSARAGLVNRWQAATCALALASLAAAGQAAGAPPSTSSPGPGGRSSSGVTASSARELVLFEAASLKDAFARLGVAFARDNAGVKIVTNAAGTQELRAQIEQGAAADVFASADREHMNALVASGLVTTPSVFACNELVVVVRPALAATVKTLADLPKVERIVVGAPEVPVGSYTQQVLGKAAAKLGVDFARGVERRIVSRELNVRQVLAKVLLGEADAAVVYRSDAASTHGKVSVVSIPTELNIVAEYPIAILRAAPHAELGRRWIELARSPEGAAALRETGFITCPTQTTTQITTQTPTKTPTKTATKTATKTH